MDTTGGQLVQVTFRLFAIYRELVGASRVDLQIPRGSTVRDAVGKLRCLAGFETLPAEPTVAVDREYTSLDRALVGGEEIALIAPVAGG